LLNLVINNTDRRFSSSSQLRPPSPTNRAMNLVRCPSTSVQGHMNDSDHYSTCLHLACRTSKVFFSTFYVLNTSCVHGRFCRFCKDAPRMEEFACLCYGRKKGRFRQNRVLVKRRLPQNHTFELAQDICDPKSFLECRTGDRSAFSANDH